MSDSFAVLILGAVKHSAPQDGSDPEYRGTTIIEVKIVIDLVKAVHGTGLQIVVHANGEAAIHLLMDIYEETQ